MALNIKTPTKSSMLIKVESISPKRNSKKTFSDTKLSNIFHKNKSQIQQSAQSSLVTKMIENQVSTQQDYQNLLIRNKQLQIKILQLQQEAQNLKKSFKKANKPLEEIKAKIQSGRLSLIEKQKYLQKFYIHLDNRLKTNMQSNLFGRLQKIKKALQQKYQQQKQQLYANLANQHQKIEVATQQLQKLRQYRDQLIKQYTQKAIQVSSHKVQSERHPSSGKNNSQKKDKNNSQKKSQHSYNSKQKASNKASNKQKQLMQLRKRKQSKLRARQQNKKECQYLKENIQKLKKQKQMVQKDSKLLKLLLNIDQQHKKHSIHVLNGYKKMFTIKYRDLLCKRKSLSISTQKNQIKASSSGQKPDLEAMKSQLTKKTAQRKILQKEIEQRNLGLEKCKLKLNQQIGQYSMLEQQVMDISNINVSFNPRATYSPQKGNNNSDVFDSRLTYTANLSEGNHRSTYTSYQKKSEGFDDDL